MFFISTAYKPNINVLEKQRPLAKNWLVWESVCSGLSRLASPGLWSPRAMEPGAMEPGAMERGEVWRLLCSA